LSDLRQTQVLTALLLVMVFALGRDEKVSVLRNRRPAANTVPVRLQHKECSELFAVSLMPLMRGRRPQTSASVSLISSSEVIEIHSVPLALRPRRS